VQKIKKFRSQKYLRWVASLPCLLCLHNECQAHHITIAEHRGFGQKVSDNFVIPLCCTHHHQLHMVSERKFWHILGITPVDYANSLFDIYNKGEINNDILINQTLYVVSKYKRIYHSNSCF
jgi:hypothetical protein